MNHPPHPHHHPAARRRHSAGVISLPAGVLALMLSMLHPGTSEAASLYTDTDPFFANNGPGVAFENQPFSEWSEWRVFGPPGGPVPADMAPDVSGAPGQSVNGAPITTTGGPLLNLVAGQSFITSGGNIYSFGTPQAWSIQDSPAYVDPLLGVFVDRVTVQARTDGSVLDPGSMILQWTDALGNTGTAMPGVQQQIFFDQQSFPVPGGGLATSTTEGNLWSWDLAGLGVSSYELLFNTGDNSSVSLTNVRIDSLGALDAAAAIPEPGRVLLLGLAAAAGLLRRRRRPATATTDVATAGPPCAAVATAFPRQAKLRRANGFTLVELLVVVTILVLLAGVTFGLARPLIDRARAAEEVAALRQLMTAYLAYPADHNGQLMPGHDNRTGVEYHDGTWLPGFMAMRYPVRLGPYLDWNFAGSVLVGEPLRRAGNDLYMASVYPSFGINATFVGGAYNTIEPSPDRVHAIQHLARAERPADQLVFVSTRHLAFADKGVMTAGPGFFQALSPRLQGRRWATGYDPDRANSWGHVDLRFGGRCVAGFLDGSARILNADEVQDMRLWSPAARIANDPDHNPL